jgi:hypothetical protein
MGYKQADQLEGLSIKKSKVVPQSIDISIVFGHWVFFYNLKGPRPLNFKKSFSAA